MNTVILNPNLLNNEIFHPPILSFYARNCGNRIAKHESLIYIDTNTRIHGSLCDFIAFSHALATYITLETRSIP